MRVLYISYDGMTDPLGQSQVIPYLTELSKNGIEFHVLSAEKTAAYQAGKKSISSLLAKHNIHWHPVKYTKTPPVISTISDIRKIKHEAEKLHKHHHFELCHCRSYIAAFAGSLLKKRHGIPFLFDMRGFYPDERVDGKLWNRKNPVFNLVYLFFKQREKDFFRKADHVISLTESGKETLCGWDHILLKDDDVTVIPCCADTDHFNQACIKEEQIIKIRKDTGITPDDFVLSYLGSLGTWYMTDEMLDFYAVLLKHKPEAKFLIITKDDPAPLIKNARNKNIPVHQMVFRAAERTELPALISLSTTSIFFIKPVFSKKASSPTKLAELLSMGVPVICNGNVGDIDRILEKHNAGLVIKDLNGANYKAAVDKMDELVKTKPENLRQIAEELFSLKKASRLYYKVYNKLIQ
ncbi:MAG: glycosyltransferase [Bacteroidales bacterium]